ncbi:MAG: AmmeMemoRadiSam system radical SAM enzyme [Bacteroidales bacterium]|nr:AmmeMemoRadiSam system radical SAM enzyme [Bacteroidales bacterium]
MKKSQYFKKLNNEKIQCQLCPHNCIINKGKNGICRVRKNISSELYSMNYGKVCSLHFDPIEKKPLYHFYPGRTIFSVGSVGCNLRCKFCQNWEISQTSVEDYPYLTDYSPEDIVKLATDESGNIGIAYTYNEPTVWYEFMLEIARLAKSKNLKNVMVTNAYINPEPLEELMPFIDAFSVDLKAFSENFYKEIVSAQLEPVKNTLKSINKKNKHLEITNLIIPGLNDDEKVFKKMINWIKDELGVNTVLHLSRYYPTYKMTIESTSVSKLIKLFKIAKEHLNFVYLGNVRTQEGQNTYCYKCGKLVINRFGYTTDLSGIDDDGKCLHCGNKIL